MTVKDVVDTGLAAAKSFAERGEAHDMEFCLDSAVLCARIAGKDISQEVKEIGALGYGRSMDLLLSSSEIYAQQGRVDVMLSSLGQARIYAEQLGKDIGERVYDIYRLGYGMAKRPR